MRRLPSHGPAPAQSRGVPAGPPEATADGVGHGHAGPWQERRFLRELPHGGQPLHDPTAERNADIVRRPWTRSVPGPQRKWPAPLRGGRGDSRHQRRFRAVQPVVHRSSAGAARPLCADHRRPGPRRRAIRIGWPVAGPAIPFVDMPVALFMIASVIVRLRPTQYAQDAASVATQLPLFYVLLILAASLPSTDARPGRGGRRHRSAERSLDLGRAPSELHRHRALATALATAFALYARERSVALVRRLPSSRHGANARPLLLAAGRRRVAEARPGSGTANAAT